MKKFRDTQYSFLFKGHQYTFSDSARNQGACPHCNASAKDVVFDEKKDKGFIGKYNFGTGIFAKCFECQSCYEKFYFHMTNEEI